MIDLLEKSKDIIKVLFGIDILILIISIFYSAKWLLITSSLINVILLGSFLIIKKYSFMFGAMAQTQKISKGLNGILGKLYG